MRASPSSAFPAHPQLDVRQMTPPERNIAVAVSRQAFEPDLRLGKVRDMPDRDRPHDEMRSGELLEPGAFAIIELLVNRRPDKLLERLDAFPDRHVDQHVRIVERPKRGRIVALVLEPPDESGAALGERVDP